MTPLEQIKEQVAQLSNALLAAHPQMPVLLRQIHTQLKQDPENVTLLSEEEIAVIVNGLKQQTQVELVTATPKKKAMSKLDVSDLF